MAAAKKSNKSNKTAHVLNLLTAPGSEKEQPAAAPAAEEGAAPQPAPSRPLTPPILEVARSNDEQLSAQIRDALESELVDQPAPTPPPAAPAKPISITPTPQDPPASTVEPIESELSDHIREALEAELTATATPTPAQTAPQPVEPAPVQTVPQPVEPAPVQTAPQPVEPAPVQTAPQPVEPALVQTAPQPVESAPVQTAPQPVEPAPAQTAPQPVEPAPVQTAPQPVEPAPVQTAPQPVEPAPAAAARVIYEEVKPDPISPTASSVPAAPPALPEEPVEDYAYINVMQALVEELAPRYMKMFGLCTCHHCQVDVKALTLNNLHPKYVVIRKKDMIPRLTVYEGRYSADIYAQLTHACRSVMEHPHHSPDRQ